jgi:leader peptidase (prepilin peptidase)/N-methyltransferase
VSAVATDQDVAGDDMSREGFPGWVRWVAFAAPFLAGAVGYASSSFPLAVVAVLGCSAVVVGWTDARLRRIPNVMCGSLVAFALAAVVLVDEAMPVGSLIGATVTALPFAVLHLISPRWVGFGDLKLLAVLGGTLGLLSAGLGLAVLWLAGVAVMVTRPWVPDAWRQSIPFGFWLSVCSVPVAVAAAAVV